MNKTLKDKIFNLIDQYDKDAPWSDNADLNRNQLSNKILSLFEEMGMEVIGKDEYGYGNKPDKQNAEQEIRNLLRDEQKLKLKELLGK